MSYMTMIWAIIGFGILWVVLIVYFDSTVTRRSESEAYEPTTIPNVPAGWPILARTENGLTAQMIKNHLESENVEAIVEESHFSRLYFAGSEPSSMATPIYVKPGEEDEAREALQATDFRRYLV